MRIEFGFQANCSEMISEITFPDLPSLMEAMKRIQEVTGWSWWYVSNDLDLQLFLPVELWDELLISNMEERTFAIDIPRLVEMWKDEIPEEILSDLRSKETGREGGSCTPVLTELSPEEHVTTEEIGDFNMAWHCVFNKKTGSLGMNFMINDHDIHLFPHLHWVRTEYGGGIDSMEGDGANPEHYMKWMEFHFDSTYRALKATMEAMTATERKERERGTFIRFLRKKILKVLYNRDLAQEIRRKVDPPERTYAKFPPLPNSQGIPDEELEEVRRYSDYVNPHLKEQ